MSNFDKPNMKPNSSEGSVDPKKIQPALTDGPDADTIGGEMHNPKVNAQRDRDTESAGVRGSNHVGQGSERGAVEQSRSAVTGQHMRKGNSGQDSFDEEDDQDMDMKLEESA